ncbi:Glycosyltransferase involved in cell wall bisynthesis [Paenibacillus sp. yr247]|uniref:glycosyltransferase family 4 protein n=1 Tax=Paenibacillus sp. yr247 TaxID=1761880 RepID=UPI00088126A0|nr:glycosyltransferase family 4 protein [Paenibacillus sp. yr247]SDN32463.1 Glycosyltransferase involved in cell wall bisynthesis [Paenibacillus sp. yr247]
MRKIKIVQIITRSDNVGGAQIHLRDLCIELQRQGHEIVILIGGEGKFIHELRNYGIQVHIIKHLVREINLYRDIMAFIEIRIALRLIKPNLVATHSSKAGWLGRATARLLGIPVVFTAHGWAFTEGVPKVRRIIYSVAERLAGMLSTRIITVSEYDRRLCEKYSVIPASKLVTIQNGIPDMEVMPIRQGAQSSIRLIMVARMERPKKQLFLLEALAGIHHLDWELDLVGDGPQLAEIQKMIVKLGLEHKVRLLGERKDVSTLLSQSHVFILTSDWEGLPLSILEAMRAGLPVLASNVGGIPELVEEGVNGYLIQNGDVHHLRSRITDLIQDDATRSQLGLAGRVKFLKKFEIQSMIYKTMEVYKQTQDSLVR